MNRRGKKERELQADQVRALCSCASLFWSTRYRDEDGEEKEMRDGEKVHSVLTRALKVILLNKDVMR